MQAIKRTILGLEHLAKHCQRLNSTKSISRHRFVRCCTSVRLYSSETLAAPRPDAEDKDYPPQIQQIVDQISRLTLIEVADLNDLLKKTLKIQDAPMMAAPAAASATPVEEEAAPAVEAPSLFTVTLVKYTDAKKVALIKELKNLIPGMNLVQAKKFVEACPQTVKSDLSKEDADKLKDAITAVGGEVTVE